MKPRRILKLTTIVHIINIIVIFMIYGLLNDTSCFFAPLVGLWGLFLLSYRIVWQYLGFERSFKKYSIDNKRAKEIINQINLARKKK